jgi:hypothetical protein
MRQDLQAKLYYYYKVTVSVGASNSAVDVIQHHAYSVQLQLLYILLSGSHRADFLRFFFRFNSRPGLLFSTFVHLSLMRAAPNLESSSLSFHT